jgi:hypothetical protein
MITPKQKYGNAVKSAALRGIEWQFTFESWMAWWGDDFHLRGPKGHNLCMARVGDTGPYSLNNVVKLTVSENVKEMRTRCKAPHTGHKHTEATKQIMSIKASGRKYSAEVNASKGRTGPRGPMSQQRSAISAARFTV